MGENQSNRPFEKSKVAIWEMKVRGASAAASLPIEL
jgi:hypothetical protein